MKSEQEIRNKIKELEEIEQRALEEKDLDCALRITATIRGLMWVLKEE